ncbi:protein FAM124A [Menidia menidia]
MGELQDPFLVSVHLLAAPGQGRVLQRAADALLAWVHPDLQLLRVSERASISHRPKWPPLPLATCQPAVAIILFLQDAYSAEEEEEEEEEEPLTVLHHVLRRAPWRYHHTEAVVHGNGRTPNASQDFFTLAPGTPLWAVRPVRRGKEAVRLTVYCRYENYPDTVRLYRLLLRRRAAQKKKKKKKKEKEEEEEEEEEDDFCFFVVYSNPGMEVQLALKRLPRGRSPALMESALVEVRVRDVGVLVPLLPNPCSPISETRWQTEDYDGNKILLQVQGSFPPSASSTFPRSAAPHRSRRHHQRAPPRPRAQYPPHPPHPLSWGGHPDAWNRSGSMFSLPNSRSTCSSPGISPAPSGPAPSGPSPAPSGQSPAPRANRTQSLCRRGRAPSGISPAPSGISPNPSGPGPAPSDLSPAPLCHRGPTHLPPFRLNVDFLVGAEETDVDTGTRVGGDPPGVMVPGSAPPLPPEDRGGGGRGAPSWTEPGTPQQDEQEFYI